ncbi:HAMP domain-containing sensor histidine kinase [Novosphingobium pokkalii]|uniref:histidine kinase n=2 Tax=Novosphingobium pokkalii TaxID=1770194 RepID=A0ABV7V024_9SPHN|nr:HAMP domain-containing sensor histidine kinase [Novosphingobium pokkalii]GHC84398.1 two-component sensor histidine kinase [Novosphingobium pokkalii]
MFARAMRQRRLSPTMLRLVAAVFVLQLLSSAAAIFFLRTQMLDVVRADREDQVIDVRDDLLAAFYSGGRGALADFIRDQRGSVADPGVFVTLAGGGAPTLTSNIDFVPAITPGPRPQAVLVRRGDSATEQDALVLASTLPDGARLTVGLMGASERRFNLAFAAAIGLTIAVAVALALVSALVLGLAISSRTHEIAKAAEELAAGNFGMRLAEGQSGDGFDHLRLQMNQMAERIASLVAELGAVSGALAHDLRSPVTRLSAAIDTALARVDEPGAVEALQAARADADGLRAMLETALEISRLEGGAVQDRRVQLDLAAVAADMVELYEPLAEQSGVTLALDLSPAWIMADRELISRALANAIDNALKYGGDAITVRTHAAEGEALLEVADNGPGIAPEDRPRVVERFVRLDNARTRPGGGLGLSMVNAVARLHRGRLELGEAHGGGLAVTLHLPA